MSVTISLLGHYHSCPCVTGSVPHVGGAIMESHALFKVNGVTVAQEGDRCICASGEYDTISQGHPALTINGVKVAYQGAATAHGGVIVQGDKAITLE